MTDVKMHQLMAVVGGIIDTMDSTPPKDSPVIEKLLTALEELYVAIDEAYPPSGYVATRGLQHEG